MYVSKQSLKDLSHIEKLKWAENEMIVVSNTLKKSFEGSGSLADIRVGIQAIRACMQSMRDQVRYHAVKSRKEQDDDIKNEEQDIVESEEID